MNPPFGTRRQGADAEFLACAVKHCLIPEQGGAVYSLHKSSTRDFLVNKAVNEWHVQDAKVLAELKFNLPKSYAFHKAKSVDVAVDLLRLQIAPTAV
jgi:predicted RNA methylase